jgi:hypothetical protein
VDAHALAAYVGGLKQSATQLEELAPSLPRVLARDRHTDAVRAATDELLAHARAGVEQLRGTAYEAIAWNALDDATHAVTELGPRTRGNVSRLARSIDELATRTDAQFEATRRAAFDADVSAGGADARAALDELVRSIDALVAPGARFDGPDAAVVGDALASSSWRLPPRPALEDIANVDRLVADAATGSRRAFDLQRLAAAWRANIVDEFTPGEQLAAHARAIVDRGADDLAPDDWRALVHIADADPAGAHVRTGDVRRLADVAYDAIHRGGGRATWDEHVAIEGMSLTLARADADLAVLRAEARELLRNGPNGFGNREWARLAEIARLDPTFRVLPSPSAQTVRDAIGDTLTESWRTDHPRALTPSGRYYGNTAARELAERWRGHLFGVGANVRMRLLDGGLDAVIRGVGRLETAAGGFTEDAVAPATRAEAARRLASFVGKVTARSVASGIRRGVDAVTAERVTAEQFDAALRGGPIPERLTIGDLPRFAQWRDTPPTGRVSMLARIVAKQEPTSMAESRTMIRQARSLPIDESMLSAGLRQRWREALAAADREDQRLRVVGAYRKGYTGHADYASLGRIRSTLELIGLELAAKSQVEQLETQAARAAAQPSAAARVATSQAATETVAVAPADHVDWTISDDPVHAIDEVLSW